MSLVPEGGADGSKAFERLKEDVEAAEHSVKNFNRVAERKIGDWPQSFRNKVKVFGYGFTIFVLNQIFCAIMFGTYAKTSVAAENGKADCASKHPGAEPFDSSGLDALFIILVSGFLILLTVFLEWAKLKVETATPMKMHKVLQALFGELNVLGFVGLVSTLFSHRSLFVEWSKAEYGECDEDHMDLLTSKLRICTFGFMVSFLCLGMWLLHQLYTQDRLWNSFEVSLLAFGDTPEVLEKRVVRASMKTTSAHWSNPYEAMHLKELLRQFQYTLLRERFITTKQPGRPKLEKDFRLNKYLTPLSAEMLAKVFVITPLSWGIFFLYLMFCIMVGAGSKPPQDPEISFDYSPTNPKTYTFLASLSSGQGWIVFMAWVILAIAAWAWFNLQGIKAQLTVQHRLINPQFKPHLSVHEKAAGDIREMLEPPYMGKDQLDAKVNKQMQLFVSKPFGSNNAEKFYVHLMQFLILMCSGLWVMTLLAAMNKMNQQAIAFAMFPNFYVIFGFMPAILADAAICLNIEMCKDNRLIDKCVNELKVDRALITLQILASLRSKVNGIKKLQTGQPVKVKTSLTATELAELQEAFNMFDKNQSGDIDAKEVKALMDALGSPVTDAEIGQLMHELDPNGDGKVTFEEFKSKLAFGGSASAADLANSADEIFDMIDQDKSGNVTTQELGTVLTNLSHGLEKDDLALVLCEFGLEGGVGITKAQFKKTVTKLATSFEA